MVRVNTEKFKKILLEERVRLKAEAVRISRRSSASDESDETSELSDYDNHPADQGSATFERTKDLALEESLNKLLECIDNALHKIENGTYGVCDRCDRNINHERLKVLPYATLCIDCQDIVESR